MCIINIDFSDAYGFLHVIIIELTVPGFDQNCLWELNKSFLTLSTTTPLMQQLLVEEGALSVIICELELFKNCSSSELGMVAVY